MVRSGLLRCHGFTFLGIDDGVSLVEYPITAYWSNTESTTIRNVNNAYSDYLDG